MLTGQPPFVREGDEAKLWAHLHDPAPRPSTTAGVPLAFDTIVARALAKSPPTGTRRRGRAGARRAGGLPRRRRDRHDGDRAAAAGAEGRAPVARRRRPGRRGGRGRRRRAAADRGSGAGGVGAAVGRSIADRDVGAAARTSRRAGAPEVKTFDHVSNRPEELVDRGPQPLGDREQPVAPGAIRAPEREPAAGRSSAAARGHRRRPRDGLDRLQAAERVVHLNARTGAFLGQIDTTLGPSAVAVGTSGLWVATQDRRDIPPISCTTRGRHERLGDADRQRRGRHGARSGRDVDGDPGHSTIRRYSADFRWRVATGLLPLRPTSHGARAALGALRRADTSRASTRAARIRTTRTLPGLHRTSRDRVAASPSSRSPRIDLSCSMPAR